MQAFDLVQPPSIDAALAAARISGAQFIADGTDLIQLVKDNVETPEFLADLEHLPLSEIRAEGNALRLGAMARMSTVAEHAAALAMVLYNAYTRQVRSYALRLSTLAALCGCTLAQPAGPPAGTAFDGVYTGQTSLVRGWGFLCGDPRLPQQMTVTQGRLEYPFQIESTRIDPVAVPIAADGTFNTTFRYFATDDLVRPDGVTYLATVSGRIVNTTLKATEYDARCTRDSTMQRR